MVDTSLKDLTPPQHTIFANGVGLSISPLKIKQLDAVMAISEPILQKFAKHHVALEQDFEGTITQFVFDDLPLYRDLVVQASGHPAEVINEMTVDELVQAIGTLIAANPLFFSVARQKLANLLSQASNPAVH